MPEADFFRRLGLFVECDFLDSATCRRLRSEMMASANAQATVAGQEASDVVDHDYRRAKRRQVTPGSAEFIVSRLDDLRPALESHFDVSLTRCQTPQFLIYGEGDFYRPHRDNSNDVRTSKYVRQRRISTVLFLNSANDTSEQTFNGGSLVFYGLMSDPRSKSRGFPLDPTTGLLVAFRTDVVHEVCPVLSGQRFSIATWFE